MSNWPRFALMLLAACIVLAGPFIRDNGVRALWIAGGLAVVLFGLRLARGRIALGAD